MQAEHVDAFLASAFAVLSEQAQAQPDRGSPLLRSGGIRSSRELTALVRVEGDVTAVILYSMSLATADKLRANQRPSAGADAERSAQDIVLQTAQAIAAGGAERLSQLGAACQPGEDLIVCGFGELLLIAVTLLVVPIFTRYGDMDIGVALQAQDGEHQEFGLLTAGGSRPSGLHESRSSREREVSAA